MKFLIATAAVASLAQSPSHSWTFDPTIGLGWSIEQHALGAREVTSEQQMQVAFSEPTAINAASVVIQLDQALIFIDPVGDQEQFRRFGRPDIVVLTSVDPDHLSIDTMIGLLRRDTLVLAPQSVMDLLPLMISNNVVAPFEIGTSQTARGITFIATPPSSNPLLGTQIYDRSRGEVGVLVEIDGQRVLF